MSTVKSRRDQFSEATRAALLDAATRRFATLGFAGTSLEDVAADIQATRGAVYHHFPSKRALFQAVFEMLEAEAVDRTVQAGTGAADPWQGALLALEEFLEHCCEPVYGRVVWQEGPLALGWAGWIEQEQKYGYGLVEHYIRGLRDGGYLSPVPLEPTARLVFGMIGAAGQALAAAPAEERPRLKAEYREVMGRLMVGVRATGEDNAQGDEGRGDGPGEAAG